MHAHTPVRATLLSAAASALRGRDCWRFERRNTLPSLRSHHHISTRRPWQTSNGRWSAELERGRHGTARAGSATSQPLHVSQCVRCRVCVAVCVLQRMLCSLCVAVLLVSCRLLVSPTAACTHEDSRKIHACIHIYI